MSNKGPNGRLSSLNAPHMSSAEPRWVSEPKLCGLATFNCMVTSLRGKTGLGLTWLADKLLLLV